MMNQVFGSTTTRDTSYDGLMTTFAAAAVVAGAVVGAYMVQSSRPSRVAASKRASLIAYLRDHLTGSDIAVHVVRQLASAHRGTPFGRVFRRLSEEFEQERVVVRSLLEHLGASPRSLKRASGFASGVVLGAVSRGSSGDLSLLRTLEGLAIGIQGKRCMWRALQGLTAELPQVQVSYSVLESKALDQWEAVDECRRAVAVKTFATPGP